MQHLYLALAMFLLLNLGAGMWRVLRGPADIDPIQSFGMGATRGAAGVLRAMSLQCQKGLPLVIALLAGDSLFHGGLDPSAEPVERYAPSAAVPASRSVKAM